MGVDLGHICSLVQRTNVLDFCRPTTGLVKIAKIHFSRFLKKSVPYMFYSKLAKIDQKWPKFNFSVWPQNWLQMIFWVLKTCLEAKITPKTWFTKILRKSKKIMIFDLSSWTSYQVRWSKIKIFSIFRVKF